MKSFVLLTVVFLTVLVTPPAAQAVIDVGVYYNKPIAFMEPGEHPQGVFIDLLEHIAKKEGWRLNYRYGSFSDCLDWLAAGDIDLPSGCWRRVGETRYGMAYIPERGTLTIHGDRAALILDQAEALGLWKIQRARFLALDAPLAMDPVAEPLFECGRAAAAPTVRPAERGAGPPTGLRRPLPD